MIDGITIGVIIENFEVWKRSINIPFFTSMDDETGELFTKKRNEKVITTRLGDWETFTLTIKEVENTLIGERKHYLKIKGSLHKNQYGGANFLPFNWQQLQEQINHICETLSINPTDAQILSLELGLNISLPFEVTPFIRQNIISYKGSSFNYYKSDKSGKCLGIYNTLKQYEVKIYDKGLQFDLPENLMRFELRFFKMQKLNERGIKFLSDLLDKPKIKGLLPLLLDAWQNVLIYNIDKSQIPATLKMKDRDLLNNARNPKFWEDLKSKNLRRFNYQRDKFRGIAATIGNDVQKLVSELIQTEWENLFENCTNLPTGEIKERTVSVIARDAELYNFTIKIKGNNVQTRFCQSCGRDITNQKQGSKFCSEKFVGEAAAHRCRNADSNARNNFKKKVERITGRGVLFDIIPFYTDISSIQYQF